MSDFLLRIIFILHHFFSRCLNRLYSADVDIRPNLALQYCDEVMQAVLMILASTNESLIPRTETEGLLVITAVVTATDDQFEKYLASAYQYIMKGVRKTDAIDVSKCAISLMGDIAQTVGEHIIPYCDDIMQLFVALVGNQNVDRSIQLTVFTSFGSIALSVGPSFEKHLPVVMVVMRESAMVVRLPKESMDKESTDKEMLAYMTELRSEIMSSYVCILSGMEENQRSDQLQPYLEGVFAVIQLVANVEEDEDLMNQTVGLIGDLASAFGAREVGALINQHRESIEKCLCGSDDEELVEFCKQKVNPFFQ